MTGVQTCALPISKGTKNMLKLAKEYNLSAVLESGKPRTIPIIQLLNDVELQVMLDMCLVHAQEREQREVQTK